MEVVGMEGHHHQWYHVEIPPIFERQYVEISLVPVVAIILVGHLHHVPEHGMLNKSPYKFKLSKH